MRNDFREPPPRPPQRVRFTLRKLLGVAVLVCLGAFAVNKLDARHIAALLAALVFGVAVGLVVQAASRGKILAAALGAVFASGALALTMEMAQPVSWARTSWVPLTIHLVDRQTGQPLEGVTLVLCPTFDTGRWVEGETDAGGVARLVGEFRSAGEDNMIASHGHINFSEYQLVVQGSEPKAVYELSDLVGPSRSIHQPPPGPIELRVDGP